MFSSGLITISMNEKYINKEIEKSLRKSETSIVSVASSKEVIDKDEYALEPWWQHWSSH